MAISRIARHTDGIRHELIGDRGDRALEDLGEPVIGMQLLPHGGRRHMPREPMDQRHLLADPQPSLQDLGLDAQQFRIVFQQRLQTRGVLPPERLPKGQRLQVGFTLAIRRRLRLSCIATCQLGV